MLCTYELKYLARHIYIYDLFGPRDLVYVANRGSKGWRGSHILVPTYIRWYRPSLGDLAGNGSWVSLGNSCTPIGPCITGGRVLQARPPPGGRRLVRIYASSYIYVLIELCTVREGRDTDCPNAYVMLWFMVCVYYDILHDRLINILLIFMYTVGVWLEIVHAHSPSLIFMYDLWM